MQPAKEKMSNMASAAKEHMTMGKAKVEEKVEKAGARTSEEKMIAEERRKTKEAEAKMELHRDKAEHAANKQSAKHAHHFPGHLHPTVTAATVAGSTAPTGPLGGHPPGHNDYL